MLWRHLAAGWRQPDGAICGTAQTGSTPCVRRCPSTSPSTTSADGRSPHGQKGALASFRFSMARHNALTARFRSLVWPAARIDPRRPAHRQPLRQSERPTGIDRLPKGRQTRARCLGLQPGGDAAHQPGGCAHPTRGCRGLPGAGCARRGLPGQCMLTPARMSPAPVGRPANAVSGPKASVVATGARAPLTGQPSDRRQRPHRAPQPASDRLIDKKRPAHWLAWVLLSGRSL